MLIKWSRKNEGAWNCNCCSRNISTLYLLPESTIARPDGTFGNLYYFIEVTFQATFRASNQFRKCTYVVQNRYQTSCIVSQRQLRSCANELIQYQYWDIKKTKEQRQRFKPSFLPPRVLSYHSAVFSQRIKNTPRLEMSSGYLLFVFLFLCSFLF